MLSIQLIVCVKVVDDSVNQLWTVKDTDIYFVDWVLYEWDTFYGGKKQVLQINLFKIE